MSAAAAPPAVHTVHPLTRRDLAALALVLIVAAALRLSAPGVVEFLHDEATLSLLAQDMLARRSLPLTGMPSSVGLPNSPVTVYIMAVPYALSGSPLLATAYVAALNVGGAGLLWLLAHRYWGPRAGLAAGLVYAASPWAALYSRKIWAQDFLTPFLLLALVLGFVGFVEGRRWAQAAFWPAFLLALQIHIAAWGLLPLGLWFLWAGRGRLSWSALGVGAALGALALAPYAAGMAQTLAEDPARLANALGGAQARSGGLALNPEVLLHAARLATGYGLELWAVAPAQAADLFAHVPTPGPLWGAPGLLALLGLAGVWVRQRGRALFLTLWAGLPVATFALTWTPLYIHYLIAALPALALLAGVGFDWAVALLARPGRPPAAEGAGRGFFGRGWGAGSPLALALWGGLGAVLLTQAAWWFGLLGYVDRTNTPGGFGTPLHYLMEVRAALAGDEDVVVISDGNRLAFDQEPVIWTVMLRGTARCVRTLAGDQGLAVLPDGPFAVLHAPNAPAGAVADLYTTDVADRHPLRPGEGAYTIHRFAAAPQSPLPPLTPLDPAPRYDNGARLTGYRLEPERLILEWRLPGPVMEQRGDLQYFAHFLDAAGNHLGQRDVSFWPGRYWCAEDRVLTWTTATPPEGTAILRVGLYLLQGGRYTNSNVLDEADNPIAPWADIPLEARP